MVSVDTVEVSGAIGEIGTSSISIYFELELFGEADWV